MRRLSFFSFFSLLFSMLFLSIIEEEGAGANELEDFEIVDDHEESKTPEEKKEPPSKVEEKPDEIEGVDKEEFEALQKTVQGYEQERAVNDAVLTLKTEYPDFDIDKIGTHLAEVAKNDGEATAEALNSPLGWEKIWLKHFHKREVSNDPFDRGIGGAKEPFDFDKGFEKANNGNKSAVNDLLANSRG